MDEDDPRFEMYARQVLDVLKRRGRMHRKQIAEAIGGFDEGALEKLLYDMSVRGLIEPAGAQGYLILWRVKPPPP